MGKLGFHSNRNYDNNRFGLLFAYNEYKSIDEIGDKMC